jgi:hypothetical protein
MYFVPRWIMGGRTGAVAAALGYLPIANCQLLLLCQLPFAAFSAPQARHYVAQRVSAGKAGSPDTSFLPEAGAQRSEATQKQARFRYVDYKIM